MIRHKEIKMVTYLFLGSIYIFMCIYIGYMVVSSGAIDDESIATYVAIGYSLVCGVIGGIYLTTAVIKGVILYAM